MARLIKPPGLILPRGYRKPVKPSIDPTHRLSRGLVGYWHFGDDPTADGAMHDLVSGNALTVRNGALAIGFSHHGGQSVVFNGSNQSLSAANGVQTYPFSLSGWFYHISGSGNVPLGNLSINAQWDGWFLTANTSSGWNFSAVSNTTFSTGAVGANTRVDTWDHVVGIATSATSRTIYVNGVQGTVDTSSSTPARTDHVFGAGAAILSTIGNFWGGAVDGVRFYNRALTAQDALQLYAEPFAGLVQAPYGIIGLTSANVSVALTGQTMTAGQGALARTASKALTGQAATAGQGTIVPTAAKVLSGQAMTAGQGTVSIPAAAYKGYAIRRTLAGGTGFPGDGANDTWADVAQAYSPSASGGTGVGWFFGPGGNVSNINSPLTAHYGGFWSNNGGGNYFRFDVPKGLIDVRLLIGDGSPPAVRLRYGAGSTSGTDYTDVTGASATSWPQVIDAHATIFADANAWETGNAALRITNLSGYLSLEKVPSVSFNQPAFISYRIVPTALVDCTFTDETGAAGAPTLFQNQVSGKLVGTIQQSIGGSPVTSLGVFESDGVTASLYLQIRYIDGVPWLAHKAVQMPALSGTYNFKIIQTDISGQAIYPNSPYVQSCAWTVTPASTKPYNDGTFNSKISTGAFLAAKKVRDVFNQTYNPTTRLGEWLGYVSGAFDFSATVYNITALRTQLISYAATAQGVSNKKFLIEIDTNGTSDWTTHAMFLASNGYGGPNGLSFCPENGNVCLVRYAASGAKPVMYGGWQINNYVRGLHIDGITFGIGVAGLLDPVNSTQVFCAIQWSYFAENALHLPILRVTNCDFGLYFNPGYTGGRTATTIDTTQFLYGIESTSNGQSVEQLIVKGCRFWGIHDGIAPFGARMLRVTDCDFAMQDDDCIATEAIRNEDASYFPNFEQYEWFDNCNMRYIIPTSDGSVHADFQQTRSLTGTPTSTGVIYRLWENSTCLINFTDAAMARNVQIISDSVAVTGCWLNNIFASYALRGVDGGQGPGTSYAEYNSIAPCHVTAAGITIQSQQIYNAYGAKIIIRNNIMGGVFSEGVDGFGGGYQGNVGYSSVNTSGVDPNTVMTGPFAADPNNATRWGGPVITEAVPTYDMPTYKGAMQVAFSPVAGVDAGFQGGLTLAGLSMIPAQGSLALSLTLALLGQSMTSGRGTISPAVAKALSGQVLTSQSGAQALSSTYALPAQPMTAGQGSVISVLGVALAGQRAISQIGPVSLGFITKVVRYLRGNRSSVNLTGDSSG